MNFDYLQTWHFLTADGGGGGDNPQFSNDKRLLWHTKSCQAKIDSAISKRSKENTQKNTKRQ